MSLFSEYPGLKRVPNFVGLAYDAARELERESGWWVRDPDPDAPPISNHWWNNQQLIVATQNPQAGSLLRRDERVSITLESPRDSTAAPAATSTPPNLHGQAPTD